MFDQNLNTTTTSTPSISASSIIASITETELTGAEKVLGNCVTPKTKKQYKRRIAKIQSWYTQMGKIFELPLKCEDIVDGFLGSLLPSTSDPDSKYQAVTSIQGYKSAIMWYYIENDQVIDPILDQTLNKFMRGYKRIVADARLDGKMEIFEGKHPLSFAGYKTLASKLMLLTPEFNTNGGRINTWNMSLFAWPFLVLQWNLMGRSVTVSTILYQHVSWQQDCMVLNIPKHKSDQEGAKCFPRHIYANPLEPSICPILSLAILIFSKTFQYDSTQLNNFQIFAGHSQETRFSKQLHRVLERLTEFEVNQLGAKPDQIGTHSTRKGGPTYCSSMVCGPNPFQVCLRAGWSLGSIQDRYIFTGDGGGDQFTGRVVSGLPNTSTQFSILPPHFVEGFNITRDDWVTILPSYEQFPHSFKQVVIYLLASLVYHCNWIENNLPCSHPFFNSLVYTSGKLTEFDDYIYKDLAHPTPAMSPSGIPPHLTLSNELKCVTEKLNELKKEIISSCSELPRSVTNNILSKVAINGAIPITHEDMDQMMGNILQEVKKMHSSIVNNSNTNNNNNNTNNTYEEPTDPRFQWFSWGGKLHMVPEGYNIPKVTLKEMWNLWWFGNIQNKIQPLRRLQSDSIQVKSQKTQLSKTRKCMKEIAMEAVKMDEVKSIEDIPKLDRKRSYEVFDTAFTRLNKKMKHTFQLNSKSDHNSHIVNNSQLSNRIGEVAIATFYDNLAKYENIHYEQFAIQFEADETLRNSESQTEPLTE